MHLGFAMPCLLADYSRRQLLVGQLRSLRFRSYRGCECSTRWGFSRTFGALGDRRLHFVAPLSARSDPGGWSGPHLQRLCSSHAFWTCLVFSFEVPACSSNGEPQLAPASLALMRFPLPSVLIDRTSSAICCGTLPGANDPQSVPTDGVSIGCLSFFVVASCWQA